MQEIPTVVVNPLPPRTHKVRICPGRGLEEDEGEGKREISAERAYALKRVCIRA